MLRAEVDDVVEGWLARCGLPLDVHRWGADEAAFAAAAVVCCSPRPAWLTPFAWDAIRACISSSIGVPTLSSGWPCRLSSGPC